MDLTPLFVALILFTIAQLGATATALVMFRSETKALRREVAEWRSADKELAQLKLDQITLTVGRIERQIGDVARLVGGGHRAVDHSQRG